MIHLTYRFAVCLMLLFFSSSALGNEPLLDEDGQPSEMLTEALLYPGEHGAKRFVYISESAEAQYCLDSSLSAKKPFAQVYPERIVWPQIGGVKIEVEKLDLKLVPEDKNVTDDSLDAGFAIRWILEAVGQDFSKSPVFKMRAVGAEVFSTKDAKVLMHWLKPLPKQICNDNTDDYPRCDLSGISLESQAVAVSPLGDLAAVATTGLKPGIALYDISDVPVKKWQILFSSDSGGALDVSFSSDGSFVAALMGNGEIHRFDAKHGGKHLAIPSKGFVAHPVPPGNAVAVGGAGGELILWRLVDGTIDWKITPKSFRGNINDMAVSQNGKIIATLEYGESQTVVRIWRVKQKAAVAQLNLEGTGFVDLALNETGDKLYLSHETNGLMMVSSKSKATPKVLGNQSVRCTSELFWVAHRSGLGCSVSGGILQMNADGTVQKTLKIHSEAKRWMVAQSPAGTTVVVGAGHLYIWR